MFALSIGLFLSNGIGLVALLLFQKSDVWAILIPLLQLLLLHSFSSLEQI